MCLIFIFNINCVSIIIVYFDILVLIFLFGGIKKAFDFKEVIIYFYNLSLCECFRRNFRSGFEWI